MATSRRMGTMIVVLVLSFVAILFGLVWQGAKGCSSGGKARAVPSDAGTRAPLVSGALVQIPQGAAAFDDLPSDRVTALYVSGERWIVGTDGGLAISDDSGQRFTVRVAGAGGLPDNRVADIDVGPDGTIFVATAAGLARGRPDRGDLAGTRFANARFPGEPGPLLAVAAASAERVYALGRARLYVSKDGGKRFGVVALPGIPPADGAPDGSTPAKARLVDLAAVDQRVYVASDEALFVSVDGGASFRRQAAAASTTPLTAVGLAGDRLMIGGRGGLLLGSKGVGDRRLTRSRVSRAVSERGVSVSALAAGSDGACVVGAEGLVYVGPFEALAAAGWKPLGWSCVDGCASRQRIVAAACAPMAGGSLAGGYPGLVLANPEGAVLRRRRTRKGLASNRLVRVWVAGRKIFALTDVSPDRVLAVSHDGGGRFTTLAKITHGLAGEPRDVEVAGTMVLVATSEGIYRSSDGGRSFQALAHGAEGLNVGHVEALGVSRRRVLAATQEGLSISEDGGRRFVNRGPANGLAGGAVHDVASAGRRIFAITGKGLFASQNSGMTFAPVEVCQGAVRAVHARMLRAACAICGDGDVRCSTDGFVSSRPLAGQGGTTLAGVRFIRDSARARWVGTDDGLWRVRAGAAEQVQLPAPVLARTIGDVATGQSEIYLATGAGLYRLRLSGVGATR